MKTVLSKILFFLGVILILSCAIFLIMTLISNNKEGITIVVSVFGVLNGILAIAVAEIHSKILG